jgi:hypothetical protein
VAALGKTNCGVPDVFKRCFYYRIYHSKTIIMKKNIGNADRIIRLLMAAVIAVLYFTNIVTGTIGIVLLVPAAVFVLTSFVGFCPIYALLGMNTCPRKIS